MSKMSQIHFEICELIERSDLSYEEIANKLQVPLSWVQAVAKDIVYL